jgi:hypothetical protein
MSPSGVGALLGRLGLLCASASIGVCGIASAAQTFGYTGDVVEIDWGGQSTRAKVERCTSDACDLHLWDSSSAKWSEGTLSQPKDKIRGLHDRGNAALHVDQLAAQGGAWNPGDRVAVRVGVEWVPSTIVRNDHPGISPYEVRFDGHSERDNTTRQPSEIRPLNAATTALVACPAADGAAQGPAELLAPFKSAISNGFTAAANHTVNAPLKVSVIFQTFQVGQPRVAEVQIQNGANVEPAPIGALVYPVSTRVAVCQYYPDEGKIDSYDGHYECFKSRRGDQVCGVSQGHRRLTSAQLATGT